MSHKTCYVRSLSFSVCNMGIQQGCGCEALGAYTQQVCNPVGPLTSAWGLSLLTAASLVSGPRVPVVARQKDHAQNGLTGWFTQPFQTTLSGPG